MSRSKSCAKCHGSMAEGFVIDHTYGSKSPSTWLEGKPVRSIWLGLRYQGKKPLQISTWRCVKCGYLENYAPAGR